MTSCKGQGGFDVIEAWYKGQVPHVQPNRPTTKQGWPHVRAGPDRLYGLMSLWTSGLPSDIKDSLHSFLQRVQEICL